MKTVLKVLLVLAVVGLVVPAFAADDQKPKREPPTAFGEIVKVDKDACKLVLKTKKEDKVEEVTYTMAADVKVSIDREPKTLDDLKPGMKCGVWVKDDKVVRIGVRTKPPEHKKPPAEQPKP